jgi:hypothetical protein
MNQPYTAAYLRALAAQIIYGAKITTEQIEVLNFYGCFEVGDLPDPVKARRCLITQAELLKEKETHG